MESNASFGRLGDSETLCKLSCITEGGDYSVLPDGDSRILRSYVFGPSGFWTMAPLRYAAKFDPFLSLDCARVEGLGAQGGGRGGAIQGKEGSKFGCVA